MKYGVIDVGSNSVRLMISEHNVTIYKCVKVTRLAQGMGDDRILQREAVERTARAVSFFVEQAKIERVDKIYIFATAAVRQSKNAWLFLNAVKEYSGCDVEVISEQKEALLGAKGALRGKDGGVIDVGGASSEIIVIKNGEIIYSKSLDCGVVKLTDKCGQERACLQEYIKRKIKGYGEIPITEFYAIGGTATSLASIDMQLQPYQPEKVNGYKLTKNKVCEMADKLTAMSVEQRRNVKGMQPERALVMGAGAVFIAILMDYLGVEQIKVSESDNLEGFLLDKTEQI